MNKYTVSVWMITYNHEKYIRMALESILCQIVDFKYEIVIGDDFSTDSTRKILTEYKKRYPEIITLLFHEKNIGMIANQNKTFNACRGDFIAMLEGDDFWIDPNKLQCQVDAMRKFPECHMSFHPVKETLYNRVLSRQAKNVQVFHINDVIKGGGYFCSTPSLMFRASVVKKLPEFLNDAPAGDYYLQILGSLHGGALYVDKVMAAYRIQSEGSWSESMKDFTKKTTFRKRTISTLSTLDEFLKYKFSDAISYRIADIYLTLALSFLVEKNYTEFKNNLALADKTYKLDTKKYKFVSLFKAFPKLLIIISRTKKIVKEVIKYAYRWKHKIILLSSLGNKSD